MFSANQPQPIPSEPDSVLMARVRRYRRMNCFALLALPSLFLIAAARDPLSGALDVVRTSRLEIVDDAGDVRLRLVGSTQGGVLELESGAGTTIARLGPNSSGLGELSLRNASGTEAAILWVRESGGGAVTVNNTRGIRVAEMSSFDAFEGAGALNLYDPEGEKVVYMGQGQLPGGSLRLVKKGKPLFAAGSNAHGYGNMVVFGQGANIGLRLDTTPSGAGFMEANGADGRPIVYLGPGGSSGKDGMLLLESESGQPLVYAGAGSNGNGLLEVCRNTGDSAIRIGLDDSGKTFFWTDKE